MSFPASAQACPTLEDLPNIQLLSLPNAYKRTRDNLDPIIVYHIISFRQAEKKSKIPGDCLSWKIDGYGLFLNTF